MHLSIQEKLDRFFFQFKEQKYKKGEILVRAGDNPPGIFYLKTGSVKKYAISKKGDEVVVNIFKPISFFPMDFAINNTVNEYFYEAITESIVYKAPKEEVVSFIKREPEVLYNLLSRVYQGLEGMTGRMTYLMAGTAYERLIIELIIQAKRFGKKTSGPGFTLDSKDALIEIKISEKDLAAQSGMTRETVSREMRILKEKNLVTFNKNSLIINNLKKLEDELVDGI